MLRSLGYFFIICTALRLFIQATTLFCWFYDFDFNLNLLFLEYGLYVDVIYTDYTTFVFYFWCLLGLILSSLLLMLYTLLLKRWVICNVFFYNHFNNFMSSTVIRLLSLLSLSFFMLCFPLFLYSFDTLLEFVFLYIR